MKSKFLISVLISAMFFINCNAEKPGTPEPNGNSVSAVVPLTNESFKKVVFNYSLNKEWKFEGTRPAIIDFYADWCAPCRQLSPLIEEIAAEYAGKIDVYKVDTDKEKLLAQSLGITGLPTLLFIPANGKPQMSMGAMPKSSLIEAVNEVLLIK